MKIQTIIEAKENHLKAALLEDGVAVGFIIIPRDGDETGPLYLAQVKKVDAKMNAAFLDLGDAGEAFLPYRQAKALKEKLTTRISGLVHEGEKILVKITAPATEHGKLPLATGNPMMAGRYALSGHLPGKGLVARGIDDGERRQALEALLGKTHNGDSLIIRSAAAHVGDDLVENEIKAQQDLWQKIEAGDAKPGLVLPALSPIEQILRDFVPADIDEILIDDQVTFLAAKKIAEEKWPDLKGKVQKFEDGNIMEAFGISEQLDNVLAGEVGLPSGGSIAIEETKAMTVIDVNSGAGRRGTSPQKLHLETNLEAADVIAREIRFQNLFGLITIDFIDMKTPEDRGRVEAALKQGLANDKMAFEMTNINRFGLLTIKRKRRGQNLRAVLEALK